jgi:tetratricopeptide (TPR) repeat protein
MRLGTLAGIAVCLAACAPAIEAVRQLSYADVLESYRAGHFAEAVRELDALPPVEVDRGVARIMDSPLATREAALLMHGDLYTSYDGIALVTTRAQRTLRRVIRLAESIYPSDSPRFLPTWYLMMIAHDHCEENHSTDFVSRARRLFKKNADVLLASGSAHEGRSLVGWGPTRTQIVGSGARATQDRYDVREELEAAARDFRQALALGPDLDEARLRLGRVLHQLGDLNGAADALQPLLARELPRSHAYLVRLFLASVVGDRGDLRRAAEIYVDAMKTWPPSQASYLGLSALLYEDGQPLRSAEILDALFGAEDVLEPYWPYVRGQCWHFEPRQAELRAMVASKR